MDVRDLLHDPTKDHPHADKLPPTGDVEPDDLREAFALGRRAQRKGDGLHPPTGPLAEHYNRGVGYEAGVKADTLPDAHGWMGVSPAVREAATIGFLVGK